MASYPWSRQSKAKGPYQRARDWVGQHVEVSTAGAFALGFFCNRIRVSLFKRYPNAAKIPYEMIQKNKWIKGKVTDVNDPDGFRIFHMPPINFRRAPKGKSDLKDEVIGIRLAGIDAPEYGHFNKPKQAFADEAIAHLRKRVEGKVVYCQLLARDRYGRIVAIPKIRRWFLPRFLTPWAGMHISFDMLRHGWAVVYDRSDAVYGKEGKEPYDILQNEAIQKRVGQWVNGPDIETPAEYKRKHSGIVTDSAADVELKPLEDTKTRPKK